MSSLLPGSEQRVWLEGQLAAMPRSVKFVLFNLHHPPVADLATGQLADHNPRPNEMALASYLEDAAKTSRAAFLVIAGHIHNYERFNVHNVVYLVSGGGGAAPYPAQRGQADLYKAPEEPNFHYLRFTLDANTLRGEMLRVTDPTANAPTHFDVADQFTLQAR